MGNIVAKVLTTGVAVAAGFVAKKVTDGTWHFVTGRGVPENPDDPDIDMKEAIAFALFSGAVITLARMLANRQTSRVLAKSQGRSREEVADAS